jgi:hypothetical protein
VPDIFDVPTTDDLKRGAKPIHTACGIMLANLAELSCTIITDDRVDVTDSVDESQCLTLTVAVVDDTDRCPYSSSNSCLLGMLLTYEDYQLLRTCHDINAFLRKNRVCDVVKQRIDVEGDVPNGVVDAMNVDTSDVEVVVVAEQHSPYLFEPQFTDAMINFESFDPGLLKRNLRIRSDHACTCAREASNACCVIWCTCCVDDRVSRLTEGPVSYSPALRKICIVMRVVNGAWFRSSVGYESVYPVARVFARLVFDRGKLVL